MQKKDTEKSVSFRDPAGTRTQGPNIKSVVLYQLSYEINLSRFGRAKIRSWAVLAKTFLLCKNGEYTLFLIE